MSSILTDSNLSLALHSNHNISKQGDEVDNPDVPATFCFRIRHDPVHRRKFLNTMCLYGSFIAMSFAKGQIGPSFLDLQAISGVGLKGGSGMLTTMYVGYMLGALVGGVLYDRVKRSLLLANAKFILACITVVIPWCSLYWIMVAAFFLFGATVGATDSICNAELQFIWGKDGRRYMQGLHFMYSFGVAVAPLIAIIYLEQPPDNPTLPYSQTNHTNKNATNSPNTTALPDIFRHGNISYNGSVKLGEYNTFIRSPDIYKAFIITGCIIMVVFLMQLTFFLRYEMTSKKTSKGSESVKEEIKESRLPLFTRVQAILHMAGILALICGIDDTLVAFLSAFCVKEFNWTKTEGSLITSLTCFVVAAGRFLSVFLIGVISPVNLVGMHTVLTFLVFVGTYICTLYKSSLGLWIIMPIFGYAKAPIFACIFTWTDEVFVIVTGKISSMYFLIITASMAINPLILGFLMDNFSNLWFCYLFMGESALLILLYCSAWFLTRRVTSRYGLNHDNVTLEVKTAETLLNNDNGRE